MSGKFTDSETLDLCYYLSELATGSANFAAQYNFQSIAIVLLMMSASECTIDDDNCRDGDQALWVEGSAQAGIFVGAVIGQVSMGFLGDLYGRIEGLMITMIIAMIGVLSSSMLSLGSATSTYAIVIASRFLVGIGLGGIYPISAVKSAENSRASTKSSIKDESRTVDSKGSSWSFFWQMPGLIGPWLVAYFAAGSQLTTEWKWRLVLVIGAIPLFFGIVALYLEKMLISIKSNDANKILHEESIIPPPTLSMTKPPNALPTNPKLSTTNSEDDKSIRSTDSSTDSYLWKTQLSSVAAPTALPFASKDMVSIMSTDSISSTEIYEMIRTHRNIRNALIGCGFTWFLFDIVVYGFGLTGGYILDAIHNSDDDNVSSTENIQYITSHQLIAVSLSTPGTMFGIFILPYVGLKYLQIHSFLFVALMLIVFSICFYPLQNGNSNALFAIYCLTSMSLNVGLGVSTFTLPAALFERRIRSTMNGICAAMGKTGAIIGSYSLLYIAEASSFPTVLLMCSGVAIMGALVTFFYIDNSELQKSKCPVKSESVRLESVVRSVEETKHNTTPSNNEKIAVVTLDGEGGQSVSPLHLNDEVTQSIEL